MSVSPDQLHSPAYYRSLTRTMLVTVILVSVTPLLLISAVTSYEFHVAYHDKVLAQLREMVQKHQQHIDQFLSEKRADIRLLSRTHPPQELRDPVRLRNLLQMAQEEFSGAFVDFGVVDDDGVQVAYAGPFLLGNADYSGADWFKQVMAREVVISDVFMGLRGSPHFIVAVRRYDGERSWVLRSTIDFMVFNALVENIRIGRTGTALILNRQGQLQTGRPGELAMDPATLAGVMSDMEAVPDTPGARFVDGAWRRSLGRSGVKVLERTDQSGVDKIFVVAPLKSGDWVLVYQQDRDDAFAELYHSRSISLGIMAAGALGIAVMAVLMTRRMVSRIRQADTEMEVMGEQVIEAGKLASIGELAAGIAHEINNPVAIMVEEAGWIGDIVGEGKALEPGSEEWGEVVKSVAQVRTQGARCKEITHKLLSFARKIDPTIHAVQLNDLVMEVAELARQRARHGNVEIRTDLDSRLPEVDASPSEMQQVLLNLVNNAVDAMDSRGGWVRVATSLDDERIVLAVQDNGEGIPKSNLPRIFDPFFTTKPVGKGTGLGLSIVYGIVKKMGGELSVESEVNVGTTFTVRLPRLQAVQAGNGG